MIGDQTQSELKIKWLPELSRKIVNRIVVKGLLVLQTPAHFGVGESIGSEILLLQDALTKTPFIPGASLAGALRNYLVVREKGYFPPQAKIPQDRGTLAEKLFGISHGEEKGEQSRVIVDDAHMVASTSKLMDVRDGVKLNPATRTAEDEKLFSIRVWNAGTTFELRFELLIYETDKNDVEIKRAFATALSGLADNSIRLGARKYRGYGRVDVQNWEVIEYDLTTPDGLIHWLTRAADSPITGDTKILFSALDVEDNFADERYRLDMQANFQLDGSLLIRAGSDDVDMAQLKSSSQPVLSGTSIAGALRARATKILNTLVVAKYGERRDDTVTQYIDALFGPLGDHNGNETEIDRKHLLWASRITIEERIVTVAKTHYDLIQNRVKIDRLTGGALETGLYSQQPLFDDGNSQVEIHLQIKAPRNDEIGLLALLLKDLWTGDLPIGGESNVGRGRLKGKRVALALKDGRASSQEWIIDQIDDKLQFSNINASADLGSYVPSLLEVL